MHTCLMSVYLHAHTHVFSLANVYRKQGKLSEALELFQESLAITQKHLGSKHPDVATTKVQPRVHVLIRMFGIMNMRAIFSQTWVRS